MHRKKNSVHIQDGHLQQLILGKQRIIDIKNGWNNPKKIKFVNSLVMCLRFKSKKSILILWLLLNIIIIVSLQL